MGASYAARDGGTSTAEAPEGQQQELQEQQPASQQMFQVCSEYRAHLFRAASAEGIGVILEAVIQRVLGVCEQYYWRLIMSRTQSISRVSNLEILQHTQATYSPSNILYTSSTSQCGKP